MVMKRSRQMRQIFWRMVVGTMSFGERVGFIEYCCGSAWRATPSMAFLEMDGDTPLYGRRRSGGDG